MLVEMLARLRGTQRALLLDMRDIEAVEMMNFEQLATVTDRLLLRARVTSRRFSTNKKAFANDRRSAPRFSAAVLALRDAEPERTLFIRARTFSTSTASAALLATAFAIAILITSVV